MNPPVDDVARRVVEIRERIASAVSRRGRGPDVVLIGASKWQPISALADAFAAGVCDFGENYAQELRDKAMQLAALVPDDGHKVRWHFIGALQSNKVKYVVGRALIHTLDRPSLAAAIAREAAKRNISQDVLVEVNFGEAQKAGIAEDEVVGFLESLGAYPALRCIGLMCIPPAGPPASAKGYFLRLARLRDVLARRTLPNVALEHLSMGMSEDFELAIEAGATMIRVGTALFGPRA